MPFAARAGCMCVLWALPAFPARVPGLATRSDVNKDLRHKAMAPKKKFCNAKDPTDKAKDTTSTNKLCSKPMPRMNNNENNENRMADESTWTSTFKLKDFKCHYCILRTWRTQLRWSPVRWWSAGSQSAGFEQLVKHSRLIRKKQKCTNFNLKVSRPQNQPWISLWKTTPIDCQHL